MTYKLVYYPDPGLFKPCEQVVEYSPQLHELLDSMKTIMEQNRGIGLSANQVGANKRVFIMQEQSSKKVVEFINPIITEQAEMGLIEAEGCLSAPGVAVQLPRAKQVTVEAFNRTGEAFTVSLEGIEAVCAQHEVDHLNGIFFLDKAPRQQRRFGYRQLEKQGLVK